MPDIKLKDTIVSYKIIRSKRKSVSIIVDYDKGIMVRAPQNISAEDIAGVVHKKAKWIQAKLTQLQEIEPAPQTKRLSAGEELTYLGSSYPIQIKTNPGSRLVNLVFDGQAFLFEIDSNFSDSQNQMAKRQVLEEWYRKHAKMKITQLVKHYAKVLRVKPHNIRVKEQKKRWGSCSSKGNLNFNWKLIMAPNNIVEYVVVHELTHLKHLNHSKDFWKLLGEVLLDYKARQEWLRVNGRTLSF